MFLLPSVLLLGTLAQRPSYSIQTTVLEAPMGTPLSLKDTAALKRAKVVFSPTIITSDDTKASVSVLENTGVGKGELGWTITATPTRQESGQVRLSLHFQQSFISSYFQKIPQRTTAAMHTAPLLLPSESVLIPFRKSDKKVQTYILVTLNQDTP